MLIVLYPSKAQMHREEIGKPLKYVETSMFGAEYKRDGTFTASNRPQLPQGYKGKGAREFFAVITMKDGLIAKVE